MNQISIRPIRIANHNQTVVRHSWKITVNHNQTIVGR
jgi:hypothetical protein